MFSRCSPVRLSSYIAIAVVQASCGTGDSIGTEPGATDSNPTDAAVRSEHETQDAGGDEFGSASGRCRMPQGLSPSPRSIAEVVQVLNALPKPVTLPCFLETLESPLAIHATKSIFSAQPAVDARNPRIFLYLDPLILSVVPEGTGSRLLEFGERRGEARSLKAELEFPIEMALDAAAPYARLRYDDVFTTCGFCHQGEEPAPDIGLPYALISPSIRPMPSDRVPLESLTAETAACDSEPQPSDRCAMLQALFSGGAPPVDWNFPETFRTFF